MIGVEDDRNYGALVGAMYSRDISNLFAADLSLDIAEGAFNRILEIASTRQVERLAVVKDAIIVAASTSGAVVANKLGNFQTSLFLKEHKETTSSRVRQVASAIAHPLMICAIESMGKSRIKQELFQVRKVPTSLKPEGSHFSNNDLWCHIVNEYPDEYARKFSELESSLEYTL